MLIHTVMKFTEWMTKAEAESPELTEEAIVQNQLEQLANRVHGILANISEEKREEFLDGFIEILRTGA